MNSECYTCGYALETIDMSEHRTDSGMCYVCNNPTSVCYNEVVCPCFSCSKWVSKGGEHMRNLK